MPAGITRQDLAVGSAAPLLREGAIIELVRFTFAPGVVVVLPEASSSLALVYVESGVLSVRINAPVTLTRVAAGGSPGEPESVRPERRSRPMQTTSSSVHRASRSRHAMTEEPLVLLMAVLGASASDSGTGDTCIVGRHCRNRPR